MSKQKVVKLDGRRISNQHAADKRARASTAPARGAEFVIHGKINSKSDSDLQKRIDQVVADALAREMDHNTDVVNDYRKLRFHSSGFKCTRVG